MCIGIVKKSAGSHKEKKRTYARSGENKGEQKCKVTPRGSLLLTKTGKRTRAYGDVTIDSYGKELWMAGETARDKERQGFSGESGQRATGRQWQKGRAMRGERCSTGRWELLQHTVGGEHGRGTKRWGAKPKVPEHERKIDAHDVLERTTEVKFFQSQSHFGKKRCQSRKNWRAKRAQSTLKKRADHRGDSTVRAESGEFVQD